MNGPKKLPPKRQPPRSASKPASPRYQPKTAAPPKRVDAAALTAAVGSAVLHAVIRERRRLAPALSAALEGRGTISVRDRLMVTRALGALLRWWGWVETLHLKRIEEQLLLAWLLDSPEVGGVAAEWAARIGRHADRLVPVGDAPNWTGRAEGLKRWASGAAVNADPWRLFPAWLRDELPVPPGETSPKMRKLDFLAALQSRPELWVAVHGKDPKTVWAELRGAELKPWIHRRVLTAAKLPADTNLTAFESYQGGHLTPHDIASQAVALVCDPDPGERWWDVNSDNGLHALHLADRMKGRGVVVASFEQERRQKATALKLRKTPFRNITTRAWDGRHVVGKASSYDGVLVDAISTGVGTWRRNPDARWTIVGSQIPELAARQLEWLTLAATAVKPGGTLVYTVATVTRSETTDVVTSFLEAHPEFQLQPFAHPLDGTKTPGTVQIWPHIHDGDGRYIARMTRRPNPLKEG